MNKNTNQKENNIVELNHYFLICTVCCSSYLCDLWLISTAGLGFRFGLGF